jgi:hypothetical protein
VADGTTDDRHWIERNQGPVVIVLLAVPFGIAWLMKRAGVSSGWADLTQLVLGVIALVVVTVLVMRSKRTPGS